jgi:polar amino acid transport system permease protein
MAGIAEALWRATPFLAGGFAGNLAISALAMLIGSLVGTALARGRDAASALARGPAGAVTGLCRNVPSFVLMFYVALFLPVEVALGSTLHAVPLAAKATLALMIPVIGFASDQGLAFRRQRQEGVPGAEAIYFVSWLQYALIILMASSIASVIGADEIVGRANRLIATNDRPAFLLATYAYVSAWFLVCGLGVSGLGTWLLRRRRLPTAILDQPT